MQFLCPEMNCDEQSERVSRMCYNLAQEWRNHYEDTQANREWFRNWIDSFINEVENQC